MSRLIESTSDTAFGIIIGCYLLKFSSKHIQTKNKLQTEQDHTRIQSEIIMDEC